MRVLGGAVLAVVRRDVQIDLDEPAQLPTVEAGEADGDRADRVRMGDGAHDVGRVAGRTDRDDHVARAQDPFQLADEDGVIPMVVGRCREQRGVVDQTEDAETAGVRRAAGGIAAGAR